MPLSRLPNASARVVHQSLRGYGAAYLAGISAAEGQYIIIGDSDDTYDFTDLERFITPLREGYDFVIESRLKGKILPGAMPKLHRYIGNPVLTGILNLLFRSGVSDAHCGMRSFTQDAYQQMELRTTGMEFASEMVINATKANLKIAEVPITYYPCEGESKLNSFRDGWRHLRFHADAVTNIPISYPRHTTFPVRLSRNSCTTPRSFANRWASL